MNERAIIHVDMDAFYASIEQRDNPKLKDKPIAVGGNPNGRGVVCAASYEARKYGVKSAMSSKKARFLCPSIIFLPVDMKKYKEVSRRIRYIFTKYSNKIEPISLDEAFLDVTGKDPIKVGKEIKEDILRATVLTASVGVSYNKFLAKLASDMDKPNGFTIISKKWAQDILRPLPVRKLWGVGPKTEEKLNKLGIYKIGEIEKYNDIILKKFGKRGLELIEFSKGIDNRPVENSLKPQSIGEENTFSEDVIDKGVLYSTIDKYVKDIIYRIKVRKILIRTITVKIKYNDFSIETRSFTLNYPTDRQDVIKKTANYILDNKFKINKKIRLLGVTVSNFIYPDDPLQLRFNIDS
ncbi:DNA polymerase IV [Dethiothermospora halolimnae]|uniref:DNA polymerase IV n=1 Tax=Dethiothermospora halolimnae TaxID=3114390 RepID=UPI003CCBBA8B